MANGRSRKRAKVAAVKAARMIRGRNPYGSGGHNIPPGWPRFEMPAFCIRGEWGRLRQECSVHGDSACGYFDDIAEPGDHGLQQRSCAVAAGSRITIAPDNGERCERLHRTELDQIRASISRDDIKTHWERWRGIDAKAQRAAKLERSDHDTGRD